MISIDYLRQFRIGPFAIFDFTTAILGMMLLSPILSWLFRKVGLSIPKKNWVILTIPLSVLAHVLVGRITPLTKDFLDLNGHYLVKLIVVVCCFASLVGIERV